MAKQDSIRESYDRAVQNLFSDRAAFAEYLKFSGRFYKLPSSQTITLFDDNPRAEMVADYETWQRFGRRIKPGGWSTDVLADGKIKRFFDISMTRGEKVPYQWTIDKKTAEKFVVGLSMSENREFTGMTDCIDYLAANAVDDRIDEVYDSLGIDEDDNMSFAESFTSMVRRVIAARCEWNSGFVYGSDGLDLSALDHIKDAGEMETLLEQVQITAKSILLSMERSINDIIFERSIENERDERADRTGNEDVRSASAPSVVRGGEEISAVDNGARREDVQIEREDVRVRADDRDLADGSGARTNVSADKPLGTGVAGIYDGELPVGYSETSREIPVGADTEENRPRSVGNIGEDAGTISENQPAPDNGKRGDVGGTLEGADRGADNGASGERPQDDTVIPESNNSNTSEDISPDVSYLAEKIAELSDKFTEKYRGGYRNFTLANFTFKTAFKSRAAEYDLNKSVRENAEKMLSDGDISFVRDYLNAIFKEAFEGRVIIDEGKTAGELLSELARLNEPEQLTIHGEAPENIPNELVLSDIPSDTDKFYVNRDIESVRWSRYDSDNAQLVYNYFTFDDLFEAVIQDDALEYLDTFSRKETVNAGSADFPEKAREFLADNEDFNSEDENFGEKLMALIEPRYAIYQLKDGEKTRDYRFASFDELKNNGLYVDRENYNRVYRARMKDGETLEDIFTKFNVDRPEDFRGHSLSTSDIIAVKQNGKAFAQYVDSAGFKEITDFFLSREERKARRTLTDNLTLIADNQLATDEMDTLGDKLFRYDNAPKYSGSGNSWLLGGMTADEFESVTTRYHNGEDIRADLAKKMYSNLNHIEFFEFPPSDGIYDVEISATKDENGITFRTKGGFEITHSWETLGEALITAAREEFDRHEELDRQYREQEENDAPELEWKPVLESIDESTGKPSIWSTEINSEKYGRYLWIIRNEHGTYAVEYDTGLSDYGSIMPISSESAGFSSLSDAQDWAQDWAEENGILQVEKIPESKGIDREETRKEKPLEEPSENLNKFYIDRDRDEICMVYYNPDSNAGGSIVYNYFSFEQLAEALSSERPFDYILDVCKTEWLDRDASVFEESMREFQKDSEDFKSYGNELPGGLSQLLTERKEAVRQGTEKPDTGNAAEAVPAEKEMSDDNLSARLAELSNEISAKQAAVTELFAKQEFSEAAGLAREMSEMARLAAELKAEIQTRVIRADQISIDDVNALHSIEPRKSILNFTSDEFEKTVAFSKAMYADLGEKSPYFRRSIEWRDSEEARIPIIEVEDRNADFKSVRDDIKSQIIMRGAAVNLDTGWNIQVSRNGLEDTVAYGKYHHDPATFNALYHIPEIIANSVLLDTVTSEHNNNVKAHNTEFMHKLYGIFKFKGESYLAKLTVEEFPKNNADLSPMRRLYNLQDIKIEPLRLIEFKENPLAQSVLNGSVISIAQLFQFVKVFDKNFYLNPNAIGRAEREAEIEAQTKFRETVQALSEMNVAEKTENVSPVTRADTLDFSFGEGEKFFTESDLLADFANENPNMSFALGNAVLEYLDEKQHSERIVNGLNAGWYDKTDFYLSGVLNGEEFYYDGRFDIGDGDGSLINHIRLFNENLVKSDSGLYNTEDRQNAQDTLDTLIPFLEKNSVLTAEEREILDKFKAQNPIRTFADVRNVEPKNITAERVGDFYEFYGEDARLVSEALGLHITSKNHMDMTGFPAYMFGDNAEKLTKFGYKLLDGAALAEERLKESTEKIKAAHEREARFDAAFKPFLESTEIGEKQKQFLERARRTMEINGFERFKEVFGAPAIRIAYGTPENAYKLFGGEEKYREIEESVNAALGVAEQTLSDEPEQLDLFGEPVTEAAPARKDGVKSSNIPDGFSVEYVPSDQPKNVDELRVGDFIKYGGETWKITDINGDFSISFENTDKNSVRSANSIWGHWKEHLTKDGFERLVPKIVEKQDLEKSLAEQADGAAFKMKSVGYSLKEEDIVTGGAKAKFTANVAAIKTLRQIEDEHRVATPDEQNTIARYVGWGGIPQAFDSDNSEWASEYTQLKELLTPDEYEAARSTVLTAHYTSPTIISAIYSTLENFGFKGGNVLEPSMGIGNFFGVMPEEMRSQSHLHGVELDDISGRIAKQLYPNADIQICGYENTAFSDNFFDAAVGNVPFGNYPVADTRYDREHFLIHDYFFAKTLDKVAPGGVVAFITSKGTLDKTSPKVREYLAKRADLIGAIRLPNNAFKGNAGTEVTSDIIFLQKRDKMSVEKPDWCYTAQIAEGISVNQYFIDHPEMILGEMRLVSGRYGEEPACVPIKGADLKEQLRGAVTRLKRDIMTVRHEKKRNEEHGIIPATADVRNFTFTEVDDKIYFRENNIMREIPFSKRNHERMRGMIGIRNTFRELVDAQSDGCSDETLAGLQFRLNAEYDAFVMNFGHISDIENRKLFAVDDDYNTLCGGLELIEPETKEITKADVFTKRTIKPYAEVTHVNTPQEALFVSLDMRGSVDIDYMSGLCGAPREEVIKELADNGFIYKNPETEEYEDAAEYLSGYVREKLRAAQKAAENDPEYERNAAALEKVLPPKLGAGDISVRLGAPWISIEDYCKFFNEYAKGAVQQGSLYSRATVLYRSVSGEYKIENKNADKSVASQSSFGTKRMNSYAIFENLLNNRDIAVYDSFELPDGKKKRVMNKDETQLAQEKARQMKEAFPKWLWADPERRDKYVNIYNELFNSLVGREYDGSHQTFPGMNPFIELNEHQKNAVMRAKLGGNTLLAHCVGAGKTFEMAAAVMEKRRLGLINKACVVVPKHLVGQMSAEWLRLYPEARLLTAKENDFNEANRQKFIGRCCTGDYDAVIMSYQQFQKIPMSVEYQQEFLGEQLNDLAAQLSEFGDKHLFADDKRSIKDIERMKKNIEAKLKKLLDTPHDNSLSFEQLGFDCVVADEAHNYKNGLVVTKMKNVSGIGSKAAKKSEDFLMKTRYLNDKYGERNLILATGTPVSNSMTELYIMQQYLRPSALQRQGLQTFDDWASTFGEVVSQLELKPAGDGFRMKKRFAKFTNLPELMQTYKDFADIRTAEMLNLPVPEVEGGKPQIISAKPNKYQQAYMKVLAERSEVIHNGSVDPSVDNMLKITNEARLLGLDARCLNPDADNYPNSKVNLLISKVMEIYTETTGQRGVQAIFCDIAINAGKKDLNEIEIEEQLDSGEKTLSAEEQAELLGASKFSVYNYIKEELIRRGIPEKEICFAGDAKDQGQRGELYAQIRAGTKRIVLASTTKMGTGANVQTRLCALHNLDIPWKPSDFEQRIGRIVRQGNRFSSVKIFNYVTEGTFDAYMLNLIVTKQKFISQLMSGKTPARTCEDVDELVLNYSEMQAIASGDPRIKEKIQLDTDVSRLRLLESEHLNKKYQLEDMIKLCEAKISIDKKSIALARGDKEFAEKNELPEGVFRITINGKVFTERKEAGAELQKAQVTFLSEKRSTEIGEYCGFKMFLNWGLVGLSQYGVSISLLRLGKGLSHSTELGLQNDLGNISRIENVLKLGIDKTISALEAEKTRYEKDLAEAERTKDAPFEYAGELAEKSRRLAQLDAELGVGKSDEVVIDEDESPNEENRDGRDNDPPTQNRKPKRPKR